MHFVARISQGGIFELIGEGGQHIDGVAREQDIVGNLKKVATDFDEVMGHLFRKKHGARARAENDIANDVFPIAVHVGHHLVRARVFGTRDAQIVTVEGLVDHAGV